MNSHSHSHSELEAMMADLESDLVERKETFKGDNANRLRQAVCAFANDLPDRRRPGVAFVGADDDGRPTGLRITDELLRDLSDMKTDGNILPPTTMTVSKSLLGGREVAVVQVWPSDAPPVRFRGRAWIRIGPRRAIASAQDERILNEKRRHRDPHFDSLPVPTATVLDLDLRRFEEEYLPRAVAAETLELNDRSVEERLAATKMVVSADDPAPTICGLLVLGKRPQDFLPGAYLQFLRVAGRDLSDPVTDNAVCAGPMVSAIHRAEEKLRSHNREAVDIASGPRETRSAVHPLSALEQLLRNAVLHRTYEGTNSPVRVYWFDDRIEIISPGGPYGVVTPESFGRPGLADYRNLNLAEAMRVLGLVQRFGSGLAIARRALRENGQDEPQFQVDPNWVHCTVRVKTGSPS